MPLSYSSHGTLAHRECVAPAWQHQEVDRLLISFVDDEAKRMREVPKEERCTPKKKVVGITLSLTVFA